MSLRDPFPIQPLLAGLVPAGTLQRPSNLSIVEPPKPKDLPFYEQIWPTVHGNYTTGFDILHSMLAEEAGSPAVVDEPPMPASAEQFLTQPVHPNSMAIVCNLASVVT